MQQPSSQRLVEVEDGIPFLTEGHPCRDLYHVLQPALRLGSVLDQCGRNPAVNQVKDKFIFCLSPEQAHNAYQITTSNKEFFTSSGVSGD